MQPNAHFEYGPCRKAVSQDGLKDLPIYMSPVIPMTAEEFDGSELDTFFRKVGIGLLQLNPIALLHARRSLYRALGYVRD